MNTTTIIDYESEHQPFFEKLNRHWIEQYFKIETLDEYVLTNPEEAVIKQGGAILMAKYNGIIAGTVALIKVDVTTFEFAKMAVDERFQRRGIAEALSYASFEKAKQLGAKSVILYTNSILKPAIHLYEKLGFKHVPFSTGEYKRANVKMVMAV